MSRHIQLPMLTQAIDVEGFCPLCKKPDTTDGMTACSNQRGHNGDVWFHNECIKPRFEPVANECALWWCKECKPRARRMPSSLTPTGQLIMIFPLPRPSTAPNQDADMQDADVQDANMPDADTDTMDMEIDIDPIGMNAGATYIPRSTQESLEAKILRGAFKKEYWDVMGRDVRVPRGCNLEDENNMSMALDAFDRKVVRGIPYHLARIIAFRELDADFSFCEFRIQTRWKCAHVKIALANAKAAGKGTNVVLYIWQLYLKACIEAKESWSLYDYREQYIHAFLSSDPNMDFPPLTTADIRAMRRWFEHLTKEIANQQQVSQGPKMTRIARHNQLRALENTRDDLHKLLGYHATGLDEPAEPAEPRLETSIEKDIEDVTTGLSSLWGELDRMEIIDQLGAFSLSS